ncbi:MAG: DUF4149 domain-containing protein [Vicinamibacterales bacterium]
MSLLRYVALVALALWVGGLVALGGVAAPTIFRVLEQQMPSGGRELAGVLFGTIFSTFQHVSWGLGLVLLASLAARAALGPRPPRFGRRMWVVSGMLAGSLLATFVIAPRIETIRASVPGPVASLPDDDARKVTFGRLHGLSNGLLLVIVAAGLGLMWTEAREQP